jgi:protein arginine N-methyltransferase 5
VKADARDVNTLQALIKEKADLVVSEMLGSFGCNELEPEVLEYIEKLFCHEKTIMIPECYASYVGESQNPLFLKLIAFQSLSIR